MSFRSWYRENKEAFWMFVGGGAACTGMITGAALNSHQHKKKVTDNFYTGRPNWTLEACKLREGYVVGAVDCNGGLTRVNRVSEEELRKAAEFLTKVADGEVNNYEFQTINQKVLK